jgi:NADH-quinone oxidoreductase subunit M
MIHLDALAFSAMAAYALVSLITLATTPRKEFEAGACDRQAIVILGTILSYAAASPSLFLAGWAVSISPIVFENAPAQRIPRGLLLLSTLTLAVFVVLNAIPGDFAAKQTTAFVAIMLAAVLRKGVFPFYFWVPIAFESGSLPVLNLIFNGHLGAYLILRFGVPLFPESAAASLSFLSVIAILTSIYAAVLAISAKLPRRILALLCVSQASFLLAGLENRNVEGVTGALVHWWVVALATTVMIVIYGALEARTTEVRAPLAFLGLGFHAPRLAVFFAIAALALIGLPGTLGFAAEDFLFHGSLESHSFSWPCAYWLSCFLAPRRTHTANS